VKAHMQMKAKAIVIAGLEDVQIFPQHLARKISHKGENA